MKILVADDDAVSRHMISSFLCTQGYEVVEACDGLEAQRCLRGPDAPSLAIVDWIMPGLDGVQLCQEIRAGMGSHYTYVLLVTSRAQKSDLVTGLRAGADDYLIKPFDFSELQARLHVGCRILQAEERLQQAQRMEALGLLTGGIAHDFNNIMMIINSYCEILLDRVTDCKLRPKLEQIQKAGQRAASLTHQLLAFSREHAIAPTALDLNSVINELRPMLQRLLGERIVWNVSLTSDLWRVNADVAQVERVLLNLAANARDAMPDGGQFTVTTENVTLGDDFMHSHPGCEPGAYVMLSVADTGCGISNEIRSRIFDPFFTTKPQGKGSGMGLASVYGVVKQSGGFITVESEVGLGSTFGIYLPVCQEVQAPPMSRPRINRPISRGQLVLVVEDEESTREAICSYLNGSGYEAIGTGNAEDALAAYTNSDVRPSIVLTDVLMPGLSGPELAKRILNIDPEATLVFMTGYADGLLTRELQSVAGFRLLQKPFELSELIAVISEAPSRL